MDSIGLKLRYFRERRNLTRRELVENICDESTLFRIEKGNTMPSMFIIDKLCEKMNIPIAMLFDDGATNYSEKSILYLKQLCRKLVYSKSFLELSLLLEELRKEINKNESVNKENDLFLIWHESIVVHKLNNDPNHAKNLLINHIPQHALLEIEISMMNSLALICKSLGQELETMYYLTKAFEAIQFNNIFEDSTLPIRVGYSYASLLFNQKDYLRVIEIVGKIISYLDMNYLFYMRGRMYHILAKTYEKMGDFDLAELYMKIAIDIFSNENKTQYKTKALADLEIIKKSRVTLKESASIC
ncbi:helix-turn-helix domain-containing protein [Paucisalibacillus globulus]|uniref:helix-turn-helix domain-containing protein n=1 Tax=Paucisalibacillus globulus TaxID=351095 RepID=UPI00041B7606|nr:helix-turn-helix transcriptional regulator [Paucisalibacillus globulus]